MGVAVAAEAMARGAAVTLVAGPMDVEAPEGATVVRVRTALEMQDACRDAFAACDVLVMAAAVGDFRAAGPTDRKIKRTGEGLTLELAPNPDILAGLGASRRDDQVLVGFALETDDPETAGREKLGRKGLDLIVVNRPETGIGGETNVVTLLDAAGAEALPEMGKDEVARRLLDRVVARRAREGDHVRPEA
jgi:phosphopantothenoylcysteine decarboxylase/phosphopantothenate--cysteine ligase